MTEETQTQFKSEGTKLFDANTENDNSATSSTDQTKTDTTGTSDQNKNETENKGGGTEENFADHPRWKEREDDWKNRFNDQEKRHSDEIAKLRDEFTVIKGGNKSDSTKSDIPAWFGGDEDQWAQFSKWNQGLLTQAEERALTRLTSKQAEEQKKIDEATEYFDGEVKAIESDKTLNPQGQEVDRNKILKFALDNDLVDSKGRWNYRVAFKLMGADKVFKAKEAMNERKQIASATTSENRAETKSSQFMTNQDFSKPENRPW